MIRNYLLGSSALLGTLVIGFASPAAAQAPAEAPPTATASTPAASDATDVEELVVTGSRIRRTEFNSAQPVTILSNETADLRGVANTAQLLQTSPAGAVAQQINNNFTGFVTTGGNGANTISLKGLGAQRTLTLVNGRRAGPAGIGGTVGPFDLNVIPSSLVDRIEILSGGASSIYGSDAVAGVVNIFTVENDDRLQMDVYASMPFEKGGEEFRVGLSKGWKFDRGHVMVAGEYYKNDGLRFKDRDYLNCPVDYLSDPDTKERIDLIDPATGSFKCVNTLTGLYISGGNRFIPDPTAVADGFNLNGFRRVNANLAAVNANLPGTPAGTTRPIYTQFVPECAGQNVPAAVTPACAEARLAFALGTQAIQPTDSPVQGYRHAISPVERMTFFSSGAYDLTETLQVYGELLYNRRESEQRSMRQLGPAINVNNPTNPFNVNNNPAYNNGPFGARAATGSQPIFVLPITRSQEVDYTRVVLGLRGDIPETLPVLGGWTWDLYGQYSKSDGTYGQDFIYADRLAAVSGAALCNQALVTISANHPNATCPTNINLNKVATVRDSALTAEEYAFLNGFETGHTTYVYQYIEGVITGDIMELPAGPLGGALGFQLRKEEIDDLPGFNSRNSNYSGSAAAGATAGSDTIKELFGEIEVPLLRDVALADRLTLNLSGRYSDYESYGTSSTYRANGTWNINNQIAVRASKGTSFRAPALYELYLGASTSFLGQLNDPCYQYGSAGDLTDRQRANCASLGIAPNSTHGGAGSFTIFAEGGAGFLKAEESDSWSIGVVFTPEFADLSVALDYSETNIENQVDRFGSVNILDECFDSPDFPNSPYCELVTRNLDTTSPTFGEVLTVSDAYLNVARQWSNSLDLNVVYRHDLGDWGGLTYTGQFTWILEWYEQIGVETDPVKNNGFTGFPDFAATMNLQWRQEDWTVTWSTQMFSKTSDVDDSISGFGTDIISFRDQTAYAKRHLEFHAQHDLSVRKLFGDDLSLTVGINNLFDEQPPYYSSGGSSRFANMRLTSQYDIIGRRAFFQVKKAW